MKMKIEIIVIGIILVSLSGCVNANIYPGTFKLSGPPSQTLELRDDGTYLLIPADPTHTSKGTYVRRGDKIELTGAFGFTSIMTISKTGLVDIDGDIWVKVPNS
jgi:hypothetical protein